MIRRDKKEERSPGSIGIRIVRKRRMIWAGSDVYGSF